MGLVFPTSFTYSYHPTFVRLDTNVDVTNTSVFITEVGVYFLFLDVVVAEVYVLCMFESCTV